MNEPQKKSRSATWLPVVLLLVALLSLFSAFRPQSNDSDFDLVGFGNLPVVDRGRAKPLDTYARISLMILSNKQTLFMGDNAATSHREHPKEWKKTTATRWLLDVVTKPQIARRYTVIRIDHPDILGLLDIQEERMYFSMHELLEHRDVLVQQFEMAQKTNQGDWTGYQRHVMKLSNRMNLYLSLEGVRSWLLIPPTNPEDITQEWLTLANASLGPGHGSDDGHNHPVPDEFSKEYAAAVRGAMDAWQPICAH